MKKQHYMTWDERQQLEALRRAGLSVAKIANQLGFCRQTIYNELKLGEYDHEIDCGYERRYSAEIAEQKHRYAQTAKGRPLKIGNHQDYADFLEEKMMSKADPRKRYSPAAALAAAKKEGYSIVISVATLYSYIEKGVFLHMTKKHLWMKPKKQKKESVKRIAHPTLPSISNRPQEINDRKEIGHWEMDLVVGKKKTRSVLLTMTERVKKDEIIVKLPNRKAETVRNVFNRLERSMPNFKEVFKSITTDNGSEFLEYEQLQRSIYGGARFQLYYCHSYAAWEKGTNENHNRMIRRWYPKGTNFDRVSKKELAELQDWMNNYPRKSLGWKTPNELALTPN